MNTKHSIYFRSVKYEWNAVRYYHFDNLIELESLRIIFIILYYHYIPVLTVFISDILQALSANSDVGFSCCFQQ